MLEYTLSRFLIIFSLMVAPLVSTAAIARPAGGFADLAERLTPAVVNISTSQKVKQRRSRGPDQPPFDRFFEEFLSRISTTNTKFISDLTNSLKLISIAR